MLPLQGPIEIVGERDKHLGPRMDFAKVTIHVEPSDQFQVVDLVDRRDGSRRFGFPEKFVCGLLDALGVSAAQTGLAVKVLLISADHHPIDSSPQAFVEAGRDAGRKLAEILTAD
jgi:hypothetical protein